MFVHIYFSVHYILHIYFAGIQLVVFKLRLFCPYMNIHWSKDLSYKYSHNTLHFFSSNTDLNQCPREECRCTNALGNNCTIDCKVKSPSPLVLTATLPPGGVGPVPAKASRLMSPPLLVAVPVELAQH